MRIMGILVASALPLFAEEEAPLKIPKFWHTITPTAQVVETIYLREACAPRKHAIFRDLGTVTMPQSPYHGHPRLDSSATVWSSDCQIHAFFLQSQVALETLDFNF